jgi:hypothetical protein
MDLVIVKGPDGISQSLSTIVVYAVFLYNIYFPSYALTADHDKLHGATENQEADMPQRRLDEDIQPVEFIDLFSFFKFLFCSLLVHPLTNYSLVVSGKEIMFPSRGGFSTSQPPPSALKCFDAKDLSICSTSATGRLLTSA